MQKYRITIAFCVGLAILGSTNGQFPRKCTDALSLQSRECCPIASDGSKCGERSQRGFCSQLSSQLVDAPLNESLPLLLDERAWWPHAFYDSVCVCAGNYDGFDCSHCKDGYEGDTCEIKSALRVRKNIKKLSDAELQRFVEVVDKSKTTLLESYVVLAITYDRILRGETPVFANVSVYDSFAWLHHYSTRINQVFPERILNEWKHNSTMTSPQRRREFAANLLLSRSPKLDTKHNADYAHKGPSLLPWHRFFMLKWERALREIVAKDSIFTFPYWDWKDLKTCDVCNDKMFGAQKPGEEHRLSDGSPFSKWRTICERYENYTAEGIQCPGVAEGYLTRNAGHFDPHKINGIPTTAEVNSMFRMDVNYDTPPYDKTSNQSFRNVLEGYSNPNTGNTDGKHHMHNAVHRWLNGTMTPPETSANDPIFIGHHCFVDSLFEIWIRKNRPRVNDEYFSVPYTPRVDQRLNDHLVAFFPLVRNIDGYETSESYGYVYDYINEDTELETFAKYKELQEENEDLRDSNETLIIVFSIVFAIIFVCPLVFLVLKKCFWSNQSNYHGLSANGKNMLIMS